MIYNIIFYGKELTCYKVMDPLNNNLFQSPYITRQPKTAALFS